MSAREGAEATRATQAGRLGSLLAMMQLAFRSLIILPLAAIFEFVRNKLLQRPPRSQIEVPPERKDFLEEGEAEMEDDDTSSDELDEGDEDDAEPSNLLRESWESTSLKAAPNTPEGWILANPGLRGFVLELQLTEGGDFLALRPNSAAPIPFENDFFKGRLLFMLATDPPDCAHLAALNTARQFEMQIQGELKIEPNGVLRMGAELTERPKLSMMTTTMVRAVMSFVQRRTAGLEWSLGDKTGPAKPYCAFPLTTGVDALVRTASDAAPALGKTLPETEADRSARRAMQDESLLRLDPGPTYSFAFYSGFVDFANWKVAGMPVGSPSLDSLIGEQPIDVVVYDWVNGNKRYWMRFRLRWNNELAERATTAAADLERHKRTAEEKLMRRRRRKNGKRALANGKTGETSWDRREATVPPDAVKDSAAVGVALCVDADSFNDEDCGDGLSHEERRRRQFGVQAGCGCYCITETKNAYAVVRELTSAPSLLLEKEETGSQPAGGFVKHGDIVRVSAESEPSRVWLVTTRGRWLAWRSSHATPQSQRERYIVELVGSEAGKQYLTLGAPFRLRSARWADMHVAATNEQAKYGGRLVRLRKCLLESPATNDSERAGSVPLASTIRPLEFVATTLPPPLQPLAHRVDAARDAVDNNRADDEKVLEAHAAAFDEVLPPADEATTDSACKQISADELTSACVATFWTVEAVCVAGWIEVVDRKHMRADRAYVVLTALRRDGTPTGRLKIVVRLRTGDELAHALGVHPAELTVGRGGKVAAPGALRRARQRAERDDRRARKATEVARERAARDVQRAAAATRAAAERARKFATRDAAKAADAARMFGARARKVALTAIDAATHHHSSQPALSPERQEHCTVGALPVAPPRSQQRQRATAFFSGLSAALHQHKPADETQPTSPVSAVTGDEALPNAGKSNDFVKVDSEEDRPVADKTENIRPPDECADKEPTEVSDVGEVSSEATYPLPAEISVLSKAEQNAAAPSPAGAAANSVRQQGALFFRKKMMPVAASLQKRINTAAKGAKDVVDRRRNRRKEEQQHPQLASCEQVDIAQLADQSNLENVHTQEPPHTEVAVSHTASSSVAENPPAFVEVNVEQTTGESHVTDANESSGHSADGCSANVRHLQEHSPDDNEGGGEDAEATECHTDSHVPIQVTTEGIEGEPAVSKKIEENSQLRACEEGTFELSENASATQSDTAVQEKTENSPEGQEDDDEAETYSHHEDDAYGTDDEVQAALAAATRDFDDEGESEGGDEEEDEDDESLLVTPRIATSSNRGEDDDDEEDDEEFLSRRMGIRSSMLCSMRSGLTNTTEPDIGQHDAVVEAPSGAVAMGETEKDPLHSRREDSFEPARETEAIRTRPWLRPEVDTQDRPPFHRSPADVCAHALGLEIRRRLDSTDSGAIDEMLVAPRSLDEGFLRGGAAEIGINLTNKEASPDGIAVVARALGEGHWVEQLAVLRAGRLDMFDPFSSSTAFSLALRDIIGARSLLGATCTEDTLPNRPCDRTQLDGKEHCPTHSSPLKSFVMHSLPGRRDAMERAPFPTLVIESVGLCHYLGFASPARRDKWAAALALARACAADPSLDSEPIPSFSRDPRDDFVLKPAAYRGDRLILNGRKFIFDVERPIFDGGRKPWEFSLALLRRVFTLTPDADDNEMATFFDEAASLRAMPLSVLDSESPNAALAFFLNLYHALLQHALLVIGAPKKPSEVAAFASSVSYDAFGDVFSLNEVAFCIIGGGIAAGCAVRRAATEESTEKPHAVFSLATGRAHERPNKLAMLASTSRKNWRDGRDRLAALYRTAKQRRSPPPASTIERDEDDENDGDREIADDETEPNASRTQASSVDRFIAIPSEAGGSSGMPAASSFWDGEALSKSPPSQPSSHVGSAHRGWPHAQPPRDDDEHWDLSLAAVDPRVVLALNTGSYDYPQAVLEFTPDGLRSQLDDAAIRFFDSPHAIQIDEARRIVTLPAICENLRDVFHDADVTTQRDSRDVLKICLHFVSKARWRILSELLIAENPPVTVKFRQPTIKFHDSLYLERTLDRSQLKAAVRATIKDLAMHDRLQPDTDYEEPDDNDEHDDASDLEDQGGLSHLDFCREPQHLTNDSMDTVDRP